jgi:hypothetical protein
LTSFSPTNILIRGSPECPDAGQEPRALYYAIPGFQQSPDAPDDIKVPLWPQSAGNFVLSPQVGKTVLDAVSELEHIPPGNGSKFRPTLTRYSNSEPASHDPCIVVPSPPLSPLVYLALRPWTLPEYMLLLSMTTPCGKEDGVAWDEIAAKFNAATNHQARNAWDCWHRWAVPWCRPQQEAEPRANTYPHAPGVQHGYNLLDLEGLIDLWSALTSTLGGHGSPSPPVSQDPTTAMAQTRHHTGYALHPGAHLAYFISITVSSRAMQHIRHPQHPQMCLRAAWVMSVTAG